MRKKVQEGGIRSLEKITDDEPPARHVDCCYPNFEPENQMLAP